MSSAPTDRSGPPAHRRPQPSLVRQTKRALQLGAGRTMASLFGVPAAQGRRFLALVHRLAEADPPRALQLVRRARGVSGSPFLVRAEALLTARVHGWAEAAPLFRRIEADRPAARADLRAHALLRARPTPAVELALPAVRDTAELAPGTAARIVIYTARFGAPPQLPPLFGTPPGLRFVCFTDQEAEAPGWEIVPTGPEASPGLHAICPHRVLDPIAPAAEWSLYLAPDRLITGNLHTLLGRWLLPCDLALWRHPHGTDWHDLAERHLVTRDADAGAVLAQAQACAAAGLKRDRGAFDTGVLWRRHGAPEVAALMEAWGAAEAEAPGARDLSFLRALPEGPAPRVLPAALGPAEANIFTARQTRQPVGRRGPAAPRRAGARPKVAFLYSERATGGGTLLRAQQLSRLIAARWSDRYDVSYVSDIAGLRDQVVIVNQRAIWQHDAPALAALRARNIATVGDWLDAPVEVEKAAAFDAHMTLSIQQMLDLNRLHPRIPAFHVTHHVNTDVPASAPPEDRLRTGYFGTLSNTSRPESLAGSVDLVDVFENPQEWIDLLPAYNCHWIVRARPSFAGRLRSFDGWKPFLKGFLAARCGAVIIVTRDDPNAAHYLGDDYPFYAESLDPGALELAYARTAAAFGGPEWRFAREIMAQVAARSSDEQVCVEFRAMIEEILR